MTTPHSRQPIRVFISYSRADSERIDRLEAELIGYGFHTWVDRDQLEGGQHWATQIERAIQGCDALLVGLSPEAVASPWVTDELLYARQLGKPIIPVLLRPVEVIPLLLVALQYIDLSTDEQQGIQQVRLRLLQSGSHAPSPQPSVAAASSVTRRIAPTVQAHVDDPTTTLVRLPPPTPAADLNDLFTQGIAAWAHGDLDLAEATLRQVVERDPQFGSGVASQQLAEAQRQLLPIQIERLRVHAIAAEARGAWGEAINAWQSLLELAPHDDEAQESLTMDQQNQGAVWIYDSARKLAASGDLPAFRQMWQLLQQQAPHFGDPHHLFLLAICNGHTDGVIDVAWAPDGTRIATASFDGTARVWEAATGKSAVSCLGHTDGLYAVAWAPNGRHLATASADKTARMWEAATGKPVYICMGHTDYVSDVTWSPDGMRLATASWDKTAQIWEATSGKLLITCEGHTDHVNMAVWSSDGQRLATASNDGTARVWEAATGKVLITCHGHVGWVDTVTWAPDGQRLATACEDGTASVWEATTGKLLATCRGHTDKVFSVAWSPDGMRLATASWDKTAQIWEATTGKVLITCRGHTEGLYALAWAPDGTRIATASNDGTARVWEAATGKVLITCQDHTDRWDRWNDRVNAVAWSPDSARLATASFDKMTRVWRA